MKRPEREYTMTIAKINPEERLKNMDTIISARINDEVDPKYQAYLKLKPFLKLVSLKEDREAGVFPASNQGMLGIGYNTDDDSPLLDDLSDPDSSHDGFHAKHYDSLMGMEFRPYLAIIDYQTGRHVGLSWLPNRSDLPMPTFQEFLQFDNCLESYATKIRKKAQSQGEA
jgi:hypothetical protein